MKKIIYLLFAVTLLSACSKENKINKNLWKKGGDWELKTYSYEYGVSGTSSYDYEYYEDCGNFKFSEDGTGVVTFKFAGEESYSQAFTYSNTEDKLTLVIDGSIAQVFNMTWKKDFIELSYDNSQPGGYKEIEKYSILKK